MYVVTKSYAISWKPKGLKFVLIFSVTEFIYRFILDFKASNFSFNLVGKTLEKH